MVTLKASCIVKPAGQTPTGLMYLSEIDQFIAITHTPLVYFYRPAGELTVNATEILKCSLSKALEIFYPLAGRLQWIARGRLELNCNSMGALFVEAESEAEIDDFGDFCPTSEIRALIPSVDYDRPIHEHPLLLVQFTKFSCGGISLGLGTSHVLVDGQSTAHFVSEWARIATGEQPQNLPLLDRTILKPEEEEPLPPPSFDQSLLFQPLLLIGHSDNSEERKKETTLTMLKLSKEQIEELKNKANKDRNSNTSNRGFTRFEAVAAHMWRCACRARRHQIEQLTSMRIPVNFRRRMEPPLPDWYFGNAFFPVTVTGTSGELVSEPLAYAAGKIRESIEMVTDEHVKSALLWMKSEPDLSKFRFSHVVGSSQGTFLGNPNISINNLIPAPLFGVDFGWGKEIYVGSGGLGHDGKSFILPDRDEDGSFIIGVCLQVAHMDAFKKFFYEHISRL